MVAFLAVGKGLVPDEAALEALCLSPTARFKRPKRYIVVDALPKSSYGQVLKPELAASLAAIVPS